VSRSAVTDGQARAVRAPVFLDLTGRDHVRRLTAAVAVSVAVLVYANALANGFVLDDGGVIVRNPLMTSASGAWRAFALPYWPDALGGGQYRPLGIVSFVIDWLVSRGDPRWFHAVNVVWHAAATALVWMLAAELLAPVAAGIAALVFAVHPVHVEAVSNVVGRLEPMAATFVLGALLAHRHAKRFAPALFALALLCKESAIVLVALVVANDLVLERDRRAAFRARRWLYAGYGVVVVTYVAVLAAVFADRSFSSPARAFIGAGVTGRLAIAARSIPHVVRLLVAPADLSASYAPNVISPDPRFTGSSALGLAILVLGAVGFWVVASRRRWPVLAFAVAWVAISLAPVANVFFPTGVVLAERTLYLASAGVCFAAGAVAERFLVTRSVAVLAATASLTLAFAVRTWMRTPAWRDDRTYLLTLVADHPESYEAHLAAGRVLKGADDYERASRELAIARRIFARDPVVYREAAEVAAAQGRKREAAALLDSANAIPGATR